MAERMGNEGVMSVQTDGVSGSNGYTAFTKIRDIDCNRDAVVGDFTSRGTGGYKSSKTGIKDLPITCSAIWDDADATLLALEDAWQNNTHVGVQMLDTAGGSGPTADFYVKNFSKSEPLEGAQTVSIELVVTYIDTAPSFA